MFTSRQALVQDLPTASDRAKLKCIAILTCAHMGGAQVCMVIPELAVNRLTIRVASELRQGNPQAEMPLGAVTHGSYAQRSLLLKYLCQCNGIEVSMTRLALDDIEHGWNEFEDDQLGRCVVDIMHRPGHLYPAGTPEAEAYLNRDASLEPPAYVPQGSKA